jgi:hypothetical protein
MLKKTLFSLFFCALPLFSMADELILNEDAPKKYVVVKGDTLWDISIIFLDQPWLWPKLWRLNPEITNPHLIYPGDVLKLVYDEGGEPMLVNERLPPEKPTFKWSPKARQQNKPKPLNILPLDVIAPYIRYENILTQQQLDNLPYIIGSNEGQKSSVDNFYVYANGDLDIAKAYGIYQKGNAIIDPETKALLGYSAVLVGTAQTVREGDIAHKKPSTLFVNSVNREIRAGNYVVPIHEGQLLPSYFTMRAANKNLRGTIIQSTTGSREFGKLDVVMINRGSEHQVQLGDVMAIQRKSPSVIETDEGPIYQSEASRWHKTGEPDYDMPEEEVGRMMVFKRYDKTSMALILTTSKPARLTDVITTP